MKRGRVPQDGPDRQRCPLPLTGVLPRHAELQCQDCERNAGSEFERLGAEPVPGVLSSPLPLGRTGVEQAGSAFSSSFEPRSG